MKKKTRSDNLWIVNVKQIFHLQSYCNFLFGYLHWGYLHYNWKQDSLSAVILCGWIFEQ